MLNRHPLARRCARALAVLACAATIAACGGGGSGDASVVANTPAAAPVTTTPPVATPPVAATPVVTGITPAVAVMGQATVFAVSGSALPEQAQFVLPGCAGATEEPGGSASSRSYRCTPLGPAGTASAGMQTAAAVAIAGTFAVRLDPPPAGLWRSVSAGQYHSLGVKTDGSLWSWGSTRPARSATARSSTATFG